MRKYSHNRSERISDQIHKDLIDILKKKVKDPRVTWVTIIDVEVVKDNTLANIYWTTLEDEKKELITKALDEAKGFIRSELAKRSQTYTIPQLKFIYDVSFIRGEDVLNLIRNI